MSIAGLVAENRRICDRRHALVGRKARGRRSRRSALPRPVSIDLLYRSHIVLDTAIDSPKNSGPSRSLGNPLSIQVPALVKIASKMGKLFLFSDDRDGGKQEWTQCHIRDTTALYKLIVNKTFSSETIESGVYFAENGFFKWDRLPELVTDVLGLPKALAEPSQEDVNQMALIMSVRPDEVAAQISGRQVVPCDLDRSNRGSANCGLCNTLAGSMHRVAEPGSSDGNTSTPLPTCGTTLSMIFD